MRASHYDIDTQTITLGLDTGGEVKINMEKEYFAYYGPGCDLELGFTDDARKEIFFIVSGSRRSVKDIIEWAQKNHDFIHRDTEREEREEDDYVREASCPHLSGRV